MSFNLLKKTITSGAHGSFEARVLDCSSTLSIVMLDANTSRGLISVELLPYATAAPDRPRFCLSAGGDPRWYSFFFTTIQHHSLHHSADYESTRCNYGNSLILLDRIFGTFREGESAIVGQDNRRRLSILEQTLFPVRGLIDDWKAHRAAKQSAKTEGETAGATAAA